MEIKVYCYECGDELEIIEEYTERGTILIYVSACLCGGEVIPCI
jgi:hypothetical protein